MYSIVRKPAPGLVIKALVIEHGGMQIIRVLRNTHTISMEDDNIAPSKPQHYRRVKKCSDLFSLHPSKPARSANLENFIDQAPGIKNSNCNQF